MIIGTIDCFSWLRVTRSERLRAGLRISCLTWVGAGWRVFVLLRSWAELSVANFLQSPAWTRPSSGQLGALPRPAMVLCSGHPLPQFCLPAVAMRRLDCLHCLVLPPPLPSPTVRLGLSRTLVRKFQAKHSTGFLGVRGVGGLTGVIYNYRDHRTGLARTGLLCALLNYVQSLNWMLKTELNLDEGN